MAVEENKNSSFLKGMITIFDLHPRITPHKKIESTVSAPKNDLKSLQEDWEKIGQDLGKFLPHEKPSD